jgi:opacity protein-like surface antigen
MKTRLKSRPISSALLCAALCFGTSAVAQDTSKTKTVSSTEDQYPDLVELDPFGGVSIFGQINRGLDERFITGGTIGGRVAFNVSKYVGLELGYNYMVNNVRLVTPVQPGYPSYDFSVRNHMLALNPIFNLTPRGSKFQPYVTVGVGAIQYTPTDHAEAVARSAAAAPFLAQNLDDNLQVAFNYGGGVKMHLSDHLGLRLDVRGILSRNPTFDLPNFPTGGVYIVNHQHLNGVEATLGLVFYLGRKAEAAAAPAVVPPPAPMSGGTITGAEGQLCMGKAINLHSTASDPAGHTLTYAWKLNGAAQGSNSADFSFTPNNAGDFQVEVTVTDSTMPSRTVTAGPITVSVKEYTQPQITGVNASPTELTCATDTTGTHTASLSAQAVGSACGGNLTYAWTVSEGSVSNGSSPNATFDASTLNFEGGAQAQTKTITATLTVTDETGKTASQSTTLTVKCPAKIVRLPDIVFTKNNARVNNCGKHILLEDVAPKLTGDYDVILVGHRDNDERTDVAAHVRGRRRAEERPLDEERVLNSAAVLSAGSGTCAHVDTSNIKVDWVGTTQTSTPDPGLCGTSTLPAAQKERRGSGATEADKNRRVEVYLVPKGSSIKPEAATDLKPLPEGAVKALGCPR